jgi:hypothetical protein
MYFKHNGDEPPQDWECVCGESEREGESLFYLTNLPGRLSHDRASLSHTHTHGGIVAGSNARQLRACKLRGLPYALRPAAGTGDCRMPSVLLQAQGTAVCPLSCGRHRSAVGSFGQFIAQSCSLLTYLCRTTHCSPI